MPRPEPSQYLVVARRYRPQTFDELVGQQHIAQALQNAITTSRVGHAYLFTGARGVGKTSTARILAKCLNCVQGPTPKPCDECDICRGIGTGEDVDVLEIDGASNRGIDEVRQLRSNVNIRPSRARFKIYIIDEVHMLTAPAFNALLKTLEEPPEHVKFIFCTTDPEKIPITVLSRCQRFDFAPVETDAILARLEQIVQAEGMTADRDALQLLARRASGSMRDSQSLLEQLLAFCDQRITVDDVHQLLGTARSTELARLAHALINRDTAAALKQLDELISRGADPGQLAEQLLGWFRDMMAAVVGCPADLMLHSGPADYGALVEAGRRFGLETMLAVAQILDETLIRMRQSAHMRTLLEIALVRICKLEDLDELATLIADVKSGVSPSRPTTSRPTSPATPIGPTTGAEIAPESPRAAPAEKKNAAAAARPSEPTAGESPRTVELTDATVQQVWQQALAVIEDTTSEFAGRSERVAIGGPNQLVVSFRAEYNHHKETCERPERRARLEDAIHRLTGRQVRIDFEVIPGGPEPAPPRQPSKTKRQRLREVEKHPLVREAIELFDAEVTDVSSSSPE